MQGSRTLSLKVNDVLLAPVVSPWPCNKDTQHRWLKWHSNWVNSFPYYHRIEEDTNVHMYVCTASIQMFLWINAHKYFYMHVGTESMYVCMYVCMYAVYIWVWPLAQLQWMAADWTFQSASRWSCARLSWCCCRSSSPGETPLAISVCLFMNTTQYVMHYKINYTTTKCQVLVLCWAY